MLEQFVLESQFALVELMEEMKLLDLEYFILLDFYVTMNHSLKKSDGKEDSKEKESLSMELEIVGYIPPNFVNRKEQS